MWQIQSLADGRIKSNSDDLIISLNRCPEGKFWVFGFPSQVIIKKTEARRQIFPEPLCLNEFIWKGNFRYKDFKAQ